MRKLLLSLVLAVAACGSTTATTVVPEPTAPPTTPPSPTTTTTTQPPATTAAAPSGFTLHGSPALGFEVALPSSWLVADLTEEDINEFAAALEADNPQIADVMRTATSSPDFAFRFWAFDLDDGSDGFQTNVNVTAFPRGPFDQPENYQQALGDQYGSLGGELITADLVDLGVDGLYVEARIPVTNAAGQSVTSNAFQLFAFGENEVINISFSTDTPARYADAVQVMRDTFKVGE